MHEHVEAAVNALRALGYKNVTHPENKRNQVWEWRTKDGRLVQVIVNNKTGVCITALDVPGDCLGDVLRAARAGDNT